MIALGEDSDFTPILCVWGVRRGETVSHVGQTWPKIFCAAEEDFELLILPLQPQLEC